MSATPIAANAAAVGLLAAMPIWTTLAADVKAPTAATNPPAQRRGESLATVAGQEVTIDSMRRLPSRDRRRLAGDGKALLEAAIAEQLWLDYALSTGAHKSDPVQEKLKGYREGLMRALEARVKKYERTLAIEEAKLKIARSVWPSDSQQRSYYKANRTRFDQPEKVRLSVIVCRTEAGAKAARARVKEGEDFAKVATALGRKNGGDVGWWDKSAGCSRLPAPVQQVVFGMKAGDVTPILHVGSHWDILKVTERVEAKARSYDEAKSLVQAELLDKMREEAIESVLADLRKKADIKIAPGAYDAIAAAFPTKKASRGGCGSGSAKTSGCGGGSGARAKSGGCGSTGRAKSGGCGSGGGGCGGCGK